MSMRVAQAVLSPKFLDGTSAIEYMVPGGDLNDGYYIRQVSIARPDGEAPFAVERHRGFKTTLTDPWPAWRVTRGSGGGTSGFFGLWLPHIDTLLADCRLVRLAVTDRVPPTRWTWIDTYRRYGHYEEQRDEKPLRKATR